MGANNPSQHYKIWGFDNVVYGPVDLPILANWIQDERVTPESWIYLESNNSWHKAGMILELKVLFPVESTSSQQPPDSALADNTSVANLKTAALRRIKILGNFDELQLEEFRKYLVLQFVKQFSTVVKQGDPGDAMYFIIEGEVRVRMIINGKENLFATLPTGEFFGEFCLFDHGPRSADVVANVDSYLLKMSAAAFQKLVWDEPELATPFLTAICKTLAARIRSDNKRYRDSIMLSNASRLPSVPQSRVH